MDNEQKKQKNVAREEAVLAFWKENDTFKKTLKKESPNGEFVFYEGPPTANGKPGIHHLESRAFKDAIPRYKTMQGFHVRRKGGWDTHGLPVELEVEKRLGLTSKKDIEKYGIAAFNEECRKSVWKYLDVWNDFTYRIGYWVDQENPYVTYHNPYIESVWSVLKKVDDQKLLYKDYKVVPWCPRCGTALSSHELAQGYQDVKDLSVYVKFKVVGQDNTYILAWTTTPWTLPGNVGLAVGEKVDYVKVKVGDDLLILAEARMSVLPEGGEVVERMMGKDLLGLEYEPLYPFLKDNLPDSEKPKLENAFKVYPADFVTTTDGTGVVHTAVMYGQEDFDLGTKVGLPKYHLVSEDGTFRPEAGFLAGRFVRDEATAVEVIKDLAHRGLLFKKEKYEHSYPHCWRCKTALIYFARDSWYIRMSSLRSELVGENEKINWEPGHIKEGRFGEWLREIKDWAISRERYWGTPLPIWKCDTCDEMKVIGGIEELKKNAHKSGNTYRVMRHGEAIHNLKGLISNDKDAPDHLTEKGREQVRASAEELKGKGIDLIIGSPFVRTRETLEIVKGTLGLTDDQVIIDGRLHEMIVGGFDGTTWADYHSTLPKTKENFSTAFPNGESYMDVKRRMMDAIADIDATYKNKNILIVTHGGPSWLAVSGSRGLKAEESLAMIVDKKDFHYLENAEVIELPYTPFPHNEEYELDLHRPYIDNVHFDCSCGGIMRRVKEVMDVWFDSGAMPFAQDHYPFAIEKGGQHAGKDVAYPADFISEAIDQTRGWFYTLHAVGALMGRGRAYKNVICLGHILDAEGKKMSKSLGNIVDPWEMIEKYGVDVLRYWMYSVTQPGDSKNFDEKTVVETKRKVFDLLDNVHTFYELYRDKNLEADSSQLQATNVLDQWILARLNQLISVATENLDNYKLLEPTRAIRDFVDDLSTWYLRRSRERIKDGDADAKRTLYLVLKTAAKLLAPFAPFTAEDIWLKLRTENDVQSVHLADWPEMKTVNSEIIKEMEQVRGIVTLGLEARQKAGIKVRQPLAKLTAFGFQLSDQYKEIIEEELNIREFILEANSKQQTAPVVLDIEITPELKKEGDFREFVRAVQDLRKQKGLTPTDTIVLTVSENASDVLAPYMESFKKTVLAKDVAFGGGTDEITIDGEVYSVTIG